MTKLIKILAAVAPDSRALARSRQFNENRNFTMRTQLGSEATGAVALSQTGEWSCPVSTRWLAGAIACDLRLGRSDRNLSFWAAAPAKTTYSAASGVEPVAQAARDLQPRRGPQQPRPQWTRRSPVPYPCVRRSSGGPPPADRRDKVA